MDNFDQKDLVLLIIDSFQKYFKIMYDITIE